MLDHRDAIDRGYLCLQGYDTFMAKFAASDTGGAAGSERVLDPKRRSGSLNNGDGPCPISVIPQGSCTVSRRGPLQRSAAGWSGFLRRVHSDQGFEHFGEASGGAVGTEALNAEASALAQQE
jgi:hypothetical protein